MRLRELIIHKLEAENIPLRVLARGMKLSYASIHNYAYMGTQPRKESLDKLARYFGESPTQLLEEDGQDIIEQLDQIRPISEKGKTAEEKRLLEDFRKADRVDRLMILRFAELAAGGAKK